MLIVATEITEFTVVKQLLNPDETCHFHPNNIRAMHTRSTCQSTGPQLLIFRQVKVEKLAMPDLAGYNHHVNLHSNSNQNEHEAAPYCSGEGHLDK